MMLGVSAAVASPVHSDGWPDAGTDGAVVRGCVTDLSVVEADRVVPHTRYRVDVEEVLVGESGPTLWLELPGADLGAFVADVVGVPRWELGDDVVIVLPADGAPSTSGVFTLSDQVLIDPLHRSDVPTTLVDLEELLSGESP